MAPKRARFRTPERAQFFPLPLWGNPIPASSRPGGRFAFLPSPPGCYPRNPNPWHAATTSVTSGISLDTRRTKSLGSRPSKRAKILLLRSGLLSGVAQKASPGPEEAFRSSRRPIGRLERREALERLLAGC